MTNLSTMDFSASHAVFSIRIGGDMTRHGRLIERGPTCSTRVLVLRTKRSDAFENTRGQTNLHLNRVELQTTHV